LGSYTEWTGFLFFCYNMTMRDEATKDFIRRHGELFWYSPENKGETVSDELLVEHILNYGTMDDVRELFQVMGLQRTAEVFFRSINMSERRRNNYNPVTLNYFTLLFNRYASGSDRGSRSMPRR
jgi:hypothetical protein